jgi:phage I-like protein
MKLKRLALIQALPPLQNNEVPTRILLVPWGDVKSGKGPFRVTDESLPAVLSMWRERGRDMVIDYEHQSMGGEFAAPEGKAPAAGWVKSMALEAVPGEGIYANVEWTSRAQQMLAAREYRYLSPVVLVRKSDGIVVDIVSAALTNTPAIRGMRPIVNKRKAELEAQDMAEKQELAELQAKHDALAAECKTLKAFQASVLTQLELKDGATPKAIEERIVALKAPPADMVPAAELAKANERIAALEQSSLDRDAEAFVARLCSEGKVSTDEEKATYRKLFLKDRASAEDVAKTLVRKVETGRVEPPPTGTVHPQERAAVILKAAKEFDGDAALQKYTSKKDYINLALHDANYQTLASADELKVVGL